MSQQVSLSKEGDMGSAVWFKMETHCQVCNSGQYFLQVILVKAMWLEMINSLAPGRFEFDIRKIIFKLTLVNGGWGISYEIALSWMPQDLTDDKSTLVQVMAWCRQATSHYLNSVDQDIQRHMASLGHNVLTCHLLNCFENSKHVKTVTCLIMTSLFHCNIIV